MNIFHKVTLKSLAINRTRTVVTIIGIILSVSMITAVTVFISSLQDYMLDNAIYVNGDWHGAFNGVNAGTAAEILNDSRVESAALAVGIGYAEIGSRNEYKPYLFIMGADDLFFERMPVHIIGGRLPLSDDEIILPVHLASNGGVVYKTGDVLSLETGDRYAGDIRLTQQNPYISNDNSDSHIENSGSADGDGNAGSDVNEGHVENNIAGVRPEELKIMETRTYTVTGFYERPGFEDYSAPGYTALTKADFGSGISGYADGYPEGNSDAGQTRLFDIYLKMKFPKNIFAYVDESGMTGSTNTDVLMYSGVSRYSNFYYVFYSFAGILIGLIMFGSISLIYNAFAISVSERTRQFGLLASIGATKRQARGMVLFEALAVSGIGIPVGIISGILGIGVTLRFVGDKFYAFYGSENLVLDLDISAAALAAAVFFAFVTVMISAWVPSGRAVRISAIDAIRLSKDIRVKSGKMKSSLITRKLFGLEGILAGKYFKRSKKKYRATVVSLFMSTVLFISASSLCSYLTDAVTGAFQDSDYDIAYYYSGVSGGYVSYDYLNSLYRKLITVADFSSSVYAVEKTIGVKMPVAQFTDEYLEYYNITPDAAYMAGTDNVANTADIDDIAGAAEHEIFIRVFGIGDDLYEQYLLLNGFDTDIYLDIADARGLGQALLSRFDASLQRFVKIPLLKEKTAEISFAAVDRERRELLPESESQYIVQSNENSDYIKIIPLKFDVMEVDTRLAEGLNTSEKYGIKIMYPMSYFLSKMNTKTCTFYFRADNPQKAFEQLEEYLMANGLYKDEYSLINTYEMNKTDRNMVTVIKVFSYGFIILISLIALANVFNTISTNVMLRRREFAMLRSVGMTERGFRRMMNYECILYGVKSLIWGIPAAFLVTWLIFRSISRAFETGFYLPWSSVVIAVGSVFAVVFSTMMYSMRIISRDNVIDSLRIDTE